MDVYRGCYNWGDVVPGDSPEYSQGLSSFGSTAVVLSGLGRGFSSILNLAVSWLVLAVSMMVSIITMGWVVIMAVLVILSLAGFLGWVVIMAVLVSFSLAGYLVIMFTTVWGSEGNS